jgi:hypothetical protein
VASRRSVPSGLLAAAALAGPLLWLAPALFRSQAPSFRDQGDFFFPLKLYTAQRLLAGEIPLWNPLSGTGEPWLANGQSGVFYPPNAFFLLPSPALAAGLFLFFHFAVCAAGCWKLLREEAVSAPAAALGAAALAGSGFAASLSAYWNHFGAWAWIPWIAYFAGRGLRTGASRAGLAATIGLQAMAGSPELSGAGVLLALIFAWRSRPAEPDWRELPRRRRIIVAVAAAGLGLALAGWVLAPMGELAWHSDRTASLGRGERESGAVGAAGAASALGMTPGRSGTDYLPSLHAGPLLLCAAAGAFTEKQRRPLAFLLAAVALAGILASAAGPPGSWLRSIPPLDRIRYPAKGLAWTFFSLAVLAGIGADSFRFARGRRVLAPLAAISLAGVLLLLLPGRPLPARLLDGAGIAALLAAAFLASPRPLSTPDYRGAALASVAALCLTASLALSSKPLFRYVAEEEIRRVPPTVPFLARIAGRVVTPPTATLSGWVIGDGRYDALAMRRQRQSLLGYTNLLAGVSTVRTAAALSAMGERKIADSMDSAPDPTLPAGAAGGRVLWTPFQPAGLGSRKVEEFFRAPINPYRPRLTFVSGFRIEADPARAWSPAARAEADWSREISLDREPEPPLRAGGKRSYVLARIALDRPEKVAADVDSDGSGILVLADLWYPGWKATVDGQPRPILRADGWLRAVALSPGSHRVEFSYSPVSFYAGSVISGAALIAIAALLLRSKPA